MNQITSQQAKEKIENKESFVLDFYATWCGPCKILTKNFEILQEKGENLPVFAFNVDSDRDFIMEMGVRSVPTLKYIKNGEIIDTKIGVQSPDQLAESIKYSLNLV
jgi:thioredoxin 1